MKDGDANRLPLPILNVEVTILLKYLVTFGKFLVKSNLSYHEQKTVRILIEQNNNITGVKFLYTSTKLYAPVATLSINHNIKFLENIKQGFKRTISCNKYRSKITTQTKDNNLDYLTDPSFRNINRFFLLSFKNGDNEPTRDYFEKYYMPLVKIKDFNALIDKKPFFHQPVKNKQEANEKLIKMSRIDGYTTVSLLGYLYHQNHYKLVGIDLSRLL